MRMRKTKIVCTLGPSTDTDEMVSKLMDAGMNVCRLNMSHGTHEETAVRIERIKRLRKEKNIPVAILLDTKGPEVRTKTVEGGKVEIAAGSEFVLTSREIEGNSREVSITYPKMVELVKPGTRVLIDDGLLAMKVVRIENGTDIVCSVTNGGALGNRKGISVPDVDLQMPSIGEKDRGDILFGIKEGIDIIAASFVCRPSDVLTIRKLCQDNGGSHVKIFSKIENRMGVDNFDEILKVSDGIMVARGDLGVEVEMEEVPVLQKSFIHKCNVAAKPVITATQMLDSMIRNPRPTRAEASDVANSIIDGTDAIMLSGETAAGKYPIEAVNTMVRIANYIEANSLKGDGHDMQSAVVNASDTRTIADAVSFACVAMAEDLGATAIITPSHSGMTARQVARFHPAHRVIAPTTSEHTYHQLGISYGVVPVMMEMSANTDEMLQSAVDVAEKAGLVKTGDVVIISAGVPVGVAGTTNLIKAHIVGNVLLRGIGVGDGRAHGRVCNINTLVDLEGSFKDGDIIVAKGTSPEMLPYMRKASAIVVEGTDENCHAAIAGQALGIPVLLDRTLTAQHMLKQNTVITVDADEGLIYNGVVE